MSDIEVTMEDAGTRSNAEARRVGFGEAFRFWLKLGFISFGGPAGQISIMHKELVEERRWLSEERFLHALNYCMLLPGPEAQQLATYIGWLLHRTLGGIVAGVLFVLPSVFIMLVLSALYAEFGRIPLVNGLLEGFKGVVIAIVVEALFKIGKRALKRNIHYIMAGLAFVLIYFLHVPFPIIVLGSALIGLLGVRYLTEVFSTRSEVSSKKVEAKTDLVISDEGVQFSHTIPNQWRLVKTLVTGLVLWSLPFIGLIAWRGVDSLHTQQYRFFSLSALVTFGGAYAVLAYVTQALTTAPYNWITPTQAVDGLALAETTPGPLIMVLQFVGFMAGWNNPADGMSQLTSGIIGALITTYATFLPSFLFIFIGAPYIEKLRVNSSLAGALTGVTAAIVGVILNLALVFAAAVIFSNGSAGQINWLPAILAIAAFIALYKFKVSVLVVVVVGGLIGVISAIV